MWQWFLGLSKKRRFLLIWNIGLAPAFLVTMITFVLISGFPLYLALGWAVMCTALAAVGFTVAWKATK
jgi:hypothetical protein